MNTLAEVMTPTSIDLTAKEQTNVRTALKFLRLRCGGWEPLAKVLHFHPKALAASVRGKTASPTLAYRIARFAKVTVDDVLTGRFPEPGTCPHCGHRPTPGT
jgi:hypothetical protein